MQRYEYKTIYVKLSPETLREKNYPAQLGKMIENESNSMAKSGWKLLQVVQPGAAVLHESILVFERSV